MKTQITITSKAIEIPASMTGIVLQQVLKQESQRIAEIRKGMKRNTRKTITVTVPDRVYFGGYREELKPLPVISPDNGD